MPPRNARSRPPAPPPPVGGGSGGANPSFFTPPAASQPLPAGGVGVGVGGRRARPAYVLPRNTGSAYSFSLANDSFSFNRSPGPAGLHGARSELKMLGGQQDEEEEEEDGDDDDDDDDDGNGSMLPLRRPGSDGPGKSHRVTQEDRMEQEDEDEGGDGEYESDPGENNSSMLAISPAIRTSTPLRKRKAAPAAAGGGISCLGTPGASPRSAGASGRVSQLSTSGMATRSMAPLNQADRVRERESMGSIASSSGVGGGGGRGSMSMSMSMDAAGGGLLTGLGMDSFDEDEEVVADSLVGRMRGWRHDAMHQHLYETAAFWGDKVMDMTGDPNDVFWLAQIYFLTHQYSRAEQLLLQPRRTSSLDRAVADNGIEAGLTGGKGKGREISFAGTNGVGRSSPHAGSSSTAHPDSFVHRATAALPTSLLARPPQTPTSASSPPPKGRRTRRSAAMDVGVGAGLLGGDDLGLGPFGGQDRAGEGDTIPIAQMSVQARYLVAQCQVRQGKWEDALYMVGETNPFKGKKKSGARVKNIDGGIKLEASLCHLRGLINLRMRETKKAKECFVEALSLDVKCYESFDMLVRTEMMSVEEEWEFVKGLEYKTQGEQDGDLVRLLYVSKLRKYKHLDEIEAARHMLIEKYGLGDNADVLLSKAEDMFMRFRFADAFAITSRILSLSPYHAATLPLHVACMYHIEHLRSSLFLLAHTLTELEPDSPTSWYAVGVWYGAGGRWTEARRYFGKANLLDPRFAPAWIAFAHSFALEGEHEAAVIAYSTAAKNYEGDHLPLLYIGMQHLQMSHMQLAEENLAAAALLHPTDPLLLNEQGVLAFYRGQYDIAIERFTEALKHTAENEQQVAASWWAPTHLNLGHAYRKSGRPVEAEKEFQHVILVVPDCVEAYVGLGMVCHWMGRTDDAVAWYHQALSIDPSDSIAAGLLSYVLEQCSGVDSLLSRKGILSR